VPRSLTVLAKDGLRGYNSLVSALKEGITAFATRDTVAKRLKTLTLDSRLKTFETEKTKIDEAAMKNGFAVTYTEAPSTLQKTGLKRKRE